MRELKLNFESRIVSIVSDQKTVIAFMDNDLEKQDFRPFFPDHTTYENSEQVTFDFANGVICMKQDFNPSMNADGVNDRYGFVKKIPMPDIREEHQRLLKAVGWTES